LGILSDKSRVIKVKFPLKKFLVNSTRPSLALPDMFVPFPLSSGVVAGGTYVAFSLDQYHESGTYAPGTKSEFVHFCGELAAFSGEQRSILGDVFVVDKSSSGGGAGPASGSGGGGAPPGLGAGPPGLGALFAGGKPKLRPVGSAGAERSPGESVSFMCVLHVSVHSHRSVFTWFC